MKKENKAMMATYVYLWHGNFGNPFQKWDKKIPLNIELKYFCRSIWDVCSNSRFFNSREQLIGFAQSSNIKISQTKNTAEDMKENRNDMLAQTGPLLNFK